MSGHSDLNPGQPPEPVDPELIDPEPIHQEPSFPHPVTFEQPAGNDLHAGRQDASGHRSDTHAGTSAQQSGGGPESEPGMQAAARALRRAAKSTAPASSGTRRTPKSTTGPAGRDPQLVGAALERFIAEQGWAVPAAAASLIGSWEQVVGSDLAAHVIPESFDQGVLVLRAESTTWATQVRLLLPALRTTIDAAVGTGVVADIKILGPAAPSWKSGPRHVAGRGPRDTYG